jgi:hypothetical protein
MRGSFSSPSFLCTACAHTSHRLFPVFFFCSPFPPSPSPTVVSCEFDRKDIEMNKLVVTMLESKYRMYDMRTQHKVEGFAHLTEKCHKSTVWMAKHLPQNRDVWLTSGGNGGLNLYRYTYPPTRTERDPEGQLRGKMGTTELLNARIVSTQPIVGVSVPCAALLHCAPFVCN